MKTLDVMTSITMFVLLVQAISAQNLPPSIIVGPPMSNTYFSGGLVLTCTASGTLPLSFQWTINTQALNLNNPGVSVDSTGGIVTFTTNPAQGYYQCSVSNNFGTALSNVTNVVQLKSSDATPGITIVQANIGTVLKLPCTIVPGQIVPSIPAFKWQTVVNLADQNPVAVVLDQRVQVDDNGTLTFSYVLSSDSLNNKIYRCHLTNLYANNMETSVAYTQIQITSNPVVPSQMTNIFSYSWPTIALERNNVSLRCFFGGAPDITVSWTRPDGSSPSVGGRYVLDRTLLMIIGVQTSDAGNYTCYGQSASGAVPPASAKINLVVQSAPIFLNLINGPNNMNVTVGDNVQVQCSAYANPPATAQWFKNGVKFSGSNLPNKYSLSPDFTTLTITNVCKTCPDGTSDLTVIQCNASNVYGYAFADGYINVLDRTVIVQPPVYTALNYPSPIILRCNATHDVATPVSYMWTLGGQPQYTSQVNTSIQGLLYIDIESDNKMGKEFEGSWTCNATNGVSSDSRAAMVGTASASTAGVWPFWWIPFVVIILFLIILGLILLICCCIYRNRGDGYPVDKEERKGGNDPEKELKDTGFHDYQRPADHPDGPVLQNQLKGMKNAGSISSSIGKVGSDDEMSLDNYSNINPGKFTEDGSFIGQYNPNQKRRGFQVHPEIPESTA